MMKKFLAAALTACMLIGTMSACGNTQEQGETASSVSGNANAEVDADNKYGMDIHARSKAEVDPNNGARPETIEGTTSFRTMSFNVLKTLTTDDNGEFIDEVLNRMEAVRQEIRDYNPDFIGLQEDVKAWTDNLNLEGYNVIQDSSMGASAERCEILYRDGIKLLKADSIVMTESGMVNGTALTVADLFEEGGRYQMSEEHLKMLGITADSDDSVFKETYTTYMTKDGTVKDYPEGYVYLGGRSMTYGVFDVNGQIVIFANAHFQNRKQNAAFYTEALAMLRNLERVKYLDKTQAIIDELKEQFPGAVAYISGDFNDLPGTGVYDAAVLDHGYQDAAVVAPESYSIAGGTWNMGFDAESHGDNYPDKGEGKDGDNLDYVFADPEIIVQKVIVGNGRADITTVDGSQATIYTADHRPIIADLAVKTETTGALMDLAVPVEYDLDKVSIYSGTPDTSWYVEGQKEFTLTTADQFMGINILRDQSEGAITFAGVTIKLGKDLILNEGTLEDIQLRDAGNYACKRLNSAYNFEGTFDGQGHTIYGAYMNLSNHGKAGIFGAVAGNAVIQNVTLENVFFSGATEAKDTMGIFASRISEDGSNVTFRNVTVNNAAMMENAGSMDYIGGFIGRVDEMLRITLTLENCSFNGKIEFPNSTCIGGFIGYVYNRNAVVTLKNCAVNGDLTAEDFCGGLIGYVGDNSTIQIENSTYAGTLTSDEQKSETIGNPDGE